MKLRIILLIIISTITAALFSQTVWTLQQCVDYAIDHNITVQQLALQRDNQTLNLKTSQLSYVPNLNAGLDQNFSFGRAAGSDNVISSQSVATTSFNVSSSMPLFTGLRIINQIASDKLNLQAAIEDLNKAKEDLSLQITAYYLNILYYKELLAIADEQITISSNLVENTKSLVESGKKSESELYENKAQLANDQQTRTEAANALQLAVLDMCQAINYPEIGNFAVADIETESLLQKTLSAFMSPEQAYQTSLSIRPAIKASEKRIESSKKDLKVAQSSYYPQLDLQAGYSTGYYHSFQLQNSAFGQQLGDNSREVVALSLTIPIFNRMATINRVKQARIAVLNQELELENTKQVLLKEIQTAYYNALAARDKYVAAGKTAEASQVSFEFEQLKYDGGKSTSFELNNAKTRLEKSLAQEAQAKFEFIFRTKIFDFYNGSTINF